MLLPTNDKQFVTFVPFTEKGLARGGMMFFEKAANHGKMPGRQIHEYFCPHQNHARSICQFHARLHPTLKGRLATPVCKIPLSYFIGFIRAAFDRRYNARAAWSSRGRAAAIDTPWGRATERRQPEGHSRPLPGTKPTGGGMLPHPRLPQ